jgi:hypothetical protein
VLGQPDNLRVPGNPTVGQLNPGEFTTVQYTYGNLGRNAFRGPAFLNWDLSLFKDFPLGASVEGRRIQFRSEFFNAFNNVSLGNPGSTLGNSNFGIISSTQHASRQIQFALKFLF